MYSYRCRAAMRVIDENGLIMSVSYRFVKCCELLYWCRKEYGINVVIYYK